MARLGFKILKEDELVYRFIQEERKRSRADGDSLPERTGAGKYVRRRPGLSTIDDCYLCSKGG